MLYQLIHGPILDPAPVDHWFGDHDDVILPMIGGGQRLHTVASLDMRAIPDLGFECSVRRLYFPFHMHSNFGTDINYFQYDPSGVRLLNPPDYEVYPEERRPPLSITLRPVTRSEARAIHRGHFLTDVPVARHPADDDWWTTPCVRCDRPTRFVLQVSSDASVALLVFDGETLYYGWCNACRVLVVEPHTW